MFKGVIDINLSVVNLLTSNKTKSLLHFKGLTVVGKNKIKHAHTKGEKLLSSCF
jgi:hypothetical protein